MTVQTVPRRKNFDMAEIWKQSSTSLATCVIAMVGFWLIQGRDMPTRLEVSAMIARESPYIRDQSLITKQLADMEKANEQVTKALNLLTNEITELRTAFGRQPK